MLKGWPQGSIPFFKAEEHCTVQSPGHTPSVGDLVELIPSHCCTTCNFYREMFVRDGQEVLDVWAIEGAGRLQ
jgi:D-serine deaminase-like pyridoxal phosphate-dependent protein